MARRKTSTTPLDIHTLERIEICYAKIKQGKGNEKAFPTGDEALDKDTWIDDLDRTLFRLRESMKDANGKIHT